MPPADKTKVPRSTVYRRPTGSLDSVLRCRRKTRAHQLFWDITEKSIIELNFFAFRMCTPGMRIRIHANWQWIRIRTIYFVLISSSLRLNHFEWQFVFFWAAKKNWNEINLNCGWLDYFLMVFYWHMKGLAASNCQSRLQLSLQKQALNQKFYHDLCTLCFFDLCLSVYAHKECE